MPRTLCTSLTLLLVVSVPTIPVKQKYLCIKCKYIIIFSIEKQSVAATLPSVAMTSRSPYPSTNNCFFPPLPSLITALVTVCIPYGKIKYKKVLL